MHVAVLQSAYVPWRGYFDIIASVDLFVIYDDVQYSKGSWRNRNKVKAKDGSKWLTVPVRVTLGQAINSVEIAYDGKDWRQQHRGLLDQALSQAPHYEEAVAPWCEVVESQPNLLSDLNVRLLRGYCDQLGLSVPFADSSAFELSGSATERLLHLLTAVGATSYLSGPAASAYLDLGAFRQAGIDLYYKNYNYDSYPQLWPGFQPDVTIIDLIANVGLDASHHIRSRAGDWKVEL